MLFTTKILKYIKTFNFVKFIISDESISEEKSIEYVEDEIFSSSRRTSATASSEKAQITPLKPQTVEKDPATNYHTYEDNNSEESKGYTRNSDDSAKDSKSSKQQPENQQFPQRLTTTTPEPTTIQIQNRPVNFAENSKSNGGDSSEASSEDPLYASDEHSKVRTR